VLSALPPAPPRRTDTPARLRRALDDAERLVAQRGRERRVV
jgi:hypothetical protein